MITCEGGRKLLVQFTCSRCKKKECLPYDEVMIREHYDQLRYSQLPKDWGKIGYSSIACADCVKAFELFMHPTREV